MRACTGNAETQSVKEKKEKKQIDKASIADAAADVCR
jgi:hypothetical protein